MGDVSSLFSTIGSGIGTAASDVGSGLGQIGGDIASGAQSLVGNIGQGVSGLFGMDGGGGPISPGTIANTAGAPAAAAAPAAVGSGAASAASFGAAPGAVGGLDATTIASQGAAPDFTSIGQINPNPSLAPNIGAAGGPTAAPPVAGSSFLNGVLSPKNAIPLGLVGYDVIKGSQTPAEVKQLQQLAAQQGGIAKTQGQLAAAEQEGILPTGAEQKVDLTLKANEAAIRTKYAQMGMSGSSAEAQDLQAARDQSLAETFQIGSTLAQQGFSEVNAATGQEDALLAAIMQEKLQQGTDLGNALALFASGLAK